jgi:hypothetical protein
MGVPHDTEAAGPETLDEPVTAKQELAATLGPLVGEANARIVDCRSGAILASRGEILWRACVAWRASAASRKSLGGVHSLRVRRRERLSLPGVCAIAR